LQENSRARLTFIHPIATPRTLSFVFKILRQFPNNELINLEFLGIFLAFFVVRILSLVSRNDKGISCFDVVVLLFCCRISKSMFWSSEQGQQDSVQRNDCTIWYASDNDWQANVRRNTPTGLSLMPSRRSEDLLPQTWLPRAFSMTYDPLLSNEYWW